MREKRLRNFIKNALKKDHLYNEDEILYMKKELHNLNNLIENKRQHTSKGFKNL
jgi:hypothetical protein